MQFPVHLAVVAVLAAPLCTGVVLRSGADQRVAATVESCGPLKEYAHARPKNFADARETKWDETTKSTIPVTFVAGDVIEFECLPGYTVDGSLNGENTFDVTCDEMGYYTVSDVCLEASKCGAVPKIDHAMPTGKVVKSSVEMGCVQGYSLDAEQVVAGGMGKNRFFMLECNEFSGEYEAFKGECQPYAFVPGKESVRIYNQVFEALFVVSCKGTLQKAFAQGGQPPEGLDNACGSFEDASLSGQCQLLVTQIKSDFESNWQEMEAYNQTRRENFTEYYEAHTEDRPTIDDEAKAFCDGLWALLEIRA
mmetsp:Transcript_46798/g.85666  ORF Transcript_46798/g.85666 Transcript_46798/m.85666 type:complete len:308 (+) Transcript_46798:79-1002(+)